MLRRAFRPLPAVIAAAALLSSAAASAQTPTPSPVPYGSDVRPMLIAPQPIADPGLSEAILFNPAALGLERGDEILYLHSETTEDDRPGEGDALLFKGSDFFNVGIEWARPAEGVDRPLFTFASGLPLSETFGIGTSYTTTLGRTFSEAAYETWNLGALWRPHRMVSFGGMMWNAADRPGPLGTASAPRYGGGVAIRPLPMYDWTEKLTLAADVAKTDGQRGEDVRFSARIEPAAGIQLFATAAEDDRYTAGLTISFRHNGAVGHSFAAPTGADEETGVVGWNAGVRVRQHRQPTLFKMRPNHVRMGIGGSLPDQSAETLFQDREQTLPGVLRQLAAIREDDSIDGVVVRLHSFGTGMARAQEVRRALQATRDAGKKVFCWMENADTRMYWVATACDRIGLHPAGMIAIDGVSTTLGFMTGTLDKLGVKVEVAKIGEYKNAPEPLTRREPSEELVTVTNELLDATFDRYVEGIAQGRKMEPSRVRSLIDGAFYPAEQAKEQGLVDVLTYPDEVRENLEDYLGKRWAEIGNYAAVAPIDRDWGRRPRIGVVYATGAVTEGTSGDTPLSGEAIMGSTTIVKALERAAADRSVKAIVLRVDSPGGSGFASDEIWHAVEKAKKKKPIVVSMGDVAASGGYYVSMGADEIFANPATITGSIGVFILRPSFRDLFDEIDFRNFQYSRGELSELFSPIRPMNEKEEQVLQRLVAAFYQDFIAKAAKGRNTTTEAIDAVGRGHVWTGAKAKELKLVDSLGGLEEAVARAKERGKIPARRPIAWKSYPSLPGFFDGVLEPDVPPGLKTALRATPLAGPVRDLEVLQAFGRGPAPWLPWRFEAPAPAQTAPAERENPWWPLPDLTAK